MAYVETLHSEGVVDKTITLPLGNGPATGYGWILTLPDEVYRVEDSPGTAAPQNERLGSAEGGSIQVVVKKPGEYVIYAKLVRPWSVDEAISEKKIHLTIR
jgi:predicted secreted protein